MVKPKRVCEMCGRLVWNRLGSAVYCVDCGRFRKSEAFFALKKKGVLK